MQKIFHNYEIINILQFINSDEELINKKLPVRLSYLLQVNLIELNKYYGSYETTVQNLIKQYDGNITEDQKIEIEDKEQQKQFDEEIQILLQEQNELDIQIVPLEVIEKCGEPPYDPLTVNELNSLSWMIDNIKKS